MREAYLKLVFPKTQSSGTVLYPGFLVIQGNNSVMLCACAAPKSLVLGPNTTVVLNLPNAITL